MSVKLAPFWNGRETLQHDLLSNTHLDVTLHWRSADLICLWSHTLASYESAHGIQIQSRGIKKPGAPASERLHASIQDSIQHWNWNGTIIMIIMAERLWIEEGGEILAAFSLCSNQWLMPGVVRSPVSWPHCFVSSDQRSRGWWRTMHQDAGDNIP